MLAFYYQKPAKKALKTDKAYSLLLEDDKSIDHHVKKSILFNNQQAWIKRDTRPFDATMGAYHGIMETGPEKRKLAIGQKTNHLI